jgi:uncharacterized SAM-dependent methyltransferase
VWNDEASRVEMHLVSATAQAARVAGERYAFAPGETIWTESSYKYDRERLGELVASSGFLLHRLWSDERERFWVAVLTSP